MPEQRKIECPAVTKTDLEEMLARRIRELISPGRPAFQLEIQNLQDRRVRQGVLFDTPLFERPSKP